MLVNGEFFDFPVTDADYDLIDSESMKHRVYVFHEDGATWSVFRKEWTKTNNA
jgi:hypothetical protein